MRHKVPLWQVGTLFLAAALVLQVLIPSRPVATGSRFGTVILYASVACFAVGLVAVTIAVGGSVIRRTRTNDGSGEQHMPARHATEDERAR